MDMSQIKTFSAPANIVICGSSGGIGSALVNALADDERAGNVFALSRTPSANGSPKVTPLPIDILNEASVAEVAGQCADVGPVDLVIVATGIKPRVPDLPGIDHPKVVGYIDVITGRAEVGKTVAIMGAGGIGLLLVETMRTSRDWENTLYIIILTMLLVVAMDQLSGWLRRRLIHGKDG